MRELYVYDNDKLGPQGDQFQDAVIDTIREPTEGGCLAQFREKYGMTENTCSFTKP